MSIAVLIGVHDGLVIAADSASTLTISTTPSALAGVLNVYDNANKIFNLYKGKPIGCVTFGAGSIGNSSIGTLIKDLRAILMGPKDKALAAGIEFDPDNYTMEGISKIVAKFLSDECQKQDAPMLLNMNIGLLIGGFSTHGSLGESWSVEIQAGKTTTTKELRPAADAGISWGGMAEVLQRMIMGFSPALFKAIAEVSTAPDGQPPVTEKDIAAQLGPLLAAKLQAPLVFAPMPIQDAIDLGRFLIHAAIMYTRFLPGAQVVGGPIEIAAVTKHEGFKWIGRKHYYDRSLNQEPRHVVVD